MSRCYTVDWYLSLPGDVKQSFDRWLDAEGLMLERIVEFELDGHHLKAKCIPREGPPEVERTFLLSELPPHQALAWGSEPTLDSVAADVIDWWHGMDPEGRATKEPAKLRKEIKEFLENPSPEEGADIGICLIVWFEQNGWSLAEYMARKAAINRSRRWEQLPDGHFQHVPEDA